jgi:hypothetical protein
VWIVAVQFDDSGVADHRHLQRVRWRNLLALLRFNR